MFSLRRSIWAPTLILVLVVLMMTMNEVSHLDRTQEQVERLGGETLRCSALPMLHRRETRNGSGNVLANADGIPWVHIPKTGSSFMNAIAYYACNLNLSKTSDVCLFKQDFSVKTGVKSWKGLHRRVGCVSSTPPFFKCTSASRDPHQRRPHESSEYCFHHQLTDALYNRHRGLLVTMLRDPSQWKISYWKDKVVLSRFESEENLRYKRGDLTFHQFLSEMAGFQSRFLSGLHSEESRPRWAAVAKQRLDQGFAFFGLTHRWDESICLFHFKFQLGRCPPCTLAKLNAARMDLPANLSQGEAAWDAIDEDLLSFATSKFEQEQSRYGADLQTCVSCGCSSA
eukprot:TRINITY_DN93526_c0_g1_i1.p1 TRINITY_DN93526_c0_g1~~TRINITY_DN93526_c0_g1_i1.p1  ORF type:complete len:341 (-),score=29.17 TRINITY_DN93526_c0_g1_i1:29-1051(-)